SGDALPVCLFSVAVAQCLAQAPARPAAWGGDPADGAGTGGRPLGDGGGGDRVTRGAGQRVAGGGIGDSAAARARRAEPGRDWAAVRRAAAPGRAALGGNQAVAAR